MREFFKTVSLPTLLAGCLYSSYTGDIPYLGALMEAISAKIDFLIFEGVKHPSAFVFFTGLSIAWLVYFIAVVWIGRIKQRALVKLGRLYVKGVDLRGCAEQAGPPNLAPDLKEKIARTEAEIIETVGTISPAKQSLFLRLDQWDHHSHPPVFLARHWNGDITLMCFCELLRRTSNLINRTDG